MAAQRRKSLPLYMVPIFIGLCGILFATQLEDSPLLKVIVLLFSVGGSLFAVGMLLARLTVSRFERIAMVIGVILLALGALVSASDFFWGMAPISDFSQVTLSAWRFVGLASLVIGIFAIVFILARREEQIEEVAERFKYLAEHMSEGFILTSAEGTVTLVNEALLQMTGLVESDIVGKDGRSLAELYDLEPMLNQMDQRARGVASEYRITWNRKGVERQLWVSGTPLFDSQGGFTGSLATIRDVTEQHQMSMRLERYAQGLQDLVEDRTEKLEQSRQRLRDLLLHMNEAFVTVDDSYRITFANERFLGLIEEPAETVIGKELFDYIAPAARGRLLDLFTAKDAAHGASPQQELALRAPDGSEVHVVVSITSIEPTPGAEERYSLVMTDIRELKRMQLQVETRAGELENANAELRMLDRAKDSFLSTVSHELRTPLSTVRGYTEMLESGTLGELSGPQANALKVMSRNIERLGTLINEMIEFSRMEVRGVSLHQTLFSGEKLLQESAASMEPQLRARDIHMNVHASPEANIVWGDRGRLQQAMTILLSNAVKFCNPGDIITLATERRVGGTVAISVADTGIGIDYNTQRRVFDKFYQADSSLSRKYEGAGIGLSIAKAIADAHGGHIDLQSEPGKGSTFTIILPNGSFTSSDPVEGPVLTASGSILLCIAEPEFALHLKTILTDRGFTVTLTSSGMAAIREVKNKRPDLLIVDDVLPDLGGQAIIQGLQSELEGTLLPILLLTEEDRIRPADDLLAPLMLYSALQKPFSLDEFELAIANSLAIEPTATASSAGPLRKRKSRTNHVLVMSQDQDLQEWVATALRTRKFRCSLASTPSEAQMNAKASAPQFVLVEPETAGAQSAELLECAHQLSAEYGAQVVVLTTNPGVNGDHASSKIIRIPCSARELVESLSISSPVMA